jgi:hypothetical protein
MVHENYLDSPRDPLSLCEWYDDSSVLTLARTDTCSLRMSLADTQDDYSKSAMFFSFLGILVPSILLKKSLNPDSIRPGSSWTKYNNHKVRLGVPPPKMNF